MAPINRSAGSLGRLQACNLALKLWGDPRITEGVLKEWLDRLITRNGMSGEVAPNVSMVPSPLRKEDSSRLGHANNADREPAAGVAGWLSFQIVDFLMDDQTAADDRVGAVKAEMGIVQVICDVTA
jgi:hypothetical protein